MKKFSEFKIGEDVKFFALVESIQKRFTPNKSSYYGITLCDGDSSVDARAWDCNIVESINVTAGAVYEFCAHINEYANKAQYVITKLRVPDSSEYDENEFFKCAPLPKEKIIEGIKYFIKKIDNKILYNLVVELIAKNKDDFFEFPAATSMHHNYLYGLAYHTYSMCLLCEKYLSIYPGMNANLLYAGAILHDLGKIKELSQSKAPVYTEEGNLLGHIVIGLNMISVEAARQGVSDTEEVKLLLHLIASHHGELEFGSPKEPGTMEAYALHLIDLTDSRLASMTSEVVKTKKGESTAPIGSLSRKSLYVPNIEGKKES